MIPMEKRANIGSEEILEDVGSFLPERSNGLCARLSDKWTVLVIWQLAIASGQRLRFSVLKCRVEGITQRMLTLTLRNLERDGLVARHYFPQIPPRVEYELTEMGVGLLRALVSLNSWIRKNIPRVEECRQAYDDANQ